MDLVNHITYMVYISLCIKGRISSPLNSSFISVQFSCSVVFDSLRPHESQHARPPCPSPAPGVYPNSCPLSRLWHLTISFPVVPFSSCPQSFPASGSFQMSQLFTSGGQSICTSNEHPGLISFRRDWLDFLAVQGTLKRLLQHHSPKASILWCSAFYGPTHIHTWLLEKPWPWLDGPLLAK